MTPEQISHLIVEDLQPGTLGIRGIDPSRGWMIAIYPDMATRAKLKRFAESLELDDAEIHPPDYYHVTLRYWKGDYDSSLQPVIDWLQSNVDNRSLRCVATDLEVFGVENSLVVRLKSPELFAFYDELNGAVMKLGVPKPNTDTAIPYISDEYKPHITLAAGVTTFPKRLPSFPIVLDTVKLVEHGPVLWQTE